MTRPLAAPSFMQYLNPLSPFLGAFGTWPNGNLYHLIVRAWCYLTVIEWTSLEDQFSIKIFCILKVVNKHILLPKMILFMFLTKALPTHPSTKYYANVRSKVSTVIVKSYIHIFSKSNKYEYAWHSKEESYCAIWQ